MFENTDVFHLFSSPFEKYYFGLMFIIQKSFFPPFYAEKLLFTSQLNISNVSTSFLIRTCIKIDST